MDLMLGLILGLFATTVVVAFVYFADGVARDRWGEPVAETTDDQPLRLNLLAFTPEEIVHVGLARVDEAACVTADTSRHSPRAGGVAAFGLLEEAAQGWQSSEERAAAPAATPCAMPSSSRA